MPSRSARHRRAGRAIPASARIVLGGLVFIMLLGLDERRAVDVVQTARAGADAALTRLKRTPDAADAAWTIPHGRHAARDRAETGDIHFIAHEIRLEHGDAWTTKPWRIAHGREALARPLRLKDQGQVELRRIDGEPAATSLCQGDRPGYVGVSQDRKRLTLILFRAGPPPDQADPVKALCGWWTYDRPPS